MPKMIVSIDGVVIKEVQLTKDRTTLGRRPYNDIVIDNLAVSGEHAVMQMSGMDVFLEDLNSTNGTYVNGKAIKKQQLQNGDTVEIGKYKIKFVHEGATESHEKTTVISGGAVVEGTDSQGSNVHGLGVGAGDLVELLDQDGLVDTQQFGVGANIAAGEGMPRQLIERAGFQVAQ